MNTILKHLLFFLLICNAFTSLAQPDYYEFEYLNTKNGLPQNHVFSISQDKEGFIWFCTMDGLSRYDGFNFVNYYHSPEDSATLSSSYVDKFLEDSQGRCWVSSNYGFNRLDRETGKVRRFYHDENNPGSLAHNTTKDIIEDHEGMLWIVHGKGVDRFDPEKELFEHYTNEKFSTGRHSGDILIDKDNNVWVLGLYGLFRVNMVKKSLDHISFPDIPSDVLVEGRNLYQDNFNNIWIALNRGLTLFDPKTNSFTLAPGLPFMLNAVDIIEYPAGNLIIGTSGFGIISYSIEQKKILKIHNYDPADPRGISSTTIYSLFEDSFNNLWIGLFNGVNRINPDVQRFKLIPNEPGLNNLKNMTLLVFEDQCGGLWSNTMEGLFYRPEPSKPYINVSKPPDFPEGYNDVRGIADLDKENILINIRANGLFVYNKKSGRIRKILEKTSLKEELILHIKNDISKPGLVWLSGKNGLGKYLAGSEKIIWYKTDSIIKHNVPFILRHFTQALSGEIYFVLHQSLIRFQPEKATFHIIPLNSEIKGNINSIQYTDHSLWIASSEAIYLINLNTRKIKEIKTTENQPLSGLGLQLDDKGNAWVARGDDILRISAHDFHTRIYASPTGFIIGIGGKTRDGMILFGGGEGILLINPDKYFKDKLKPKIVFTGIQMAHKTLDLGRENEFVKDIYLDYQDKVFTLGFAALHFIHRENIKYRYKLEGFDKEWVNAGTNRQVTYTNLHPGKYIFWAEAITEDGLISENSIKINIHIKAPFHMTRPFYGLVALLIGMVLIIFHSIRRKANKAMREKKLAEKNARYKDLFMANLSHEIRTPLNAIIGLNKLLLDTPLNHKQNQYVEAIKTSGENLVWIVNDILDQAKIESGKFTVHQNAFDLNVLLARLETLFAYRAKEKGLEFKVSTNSSIPEALVSDQVRLFQILTNLLNNAIKFTEHGYIHLTVTAQPTENNQYVMGFCVTDTGIGIPNDKLSVIFESFQQLSEVESTGNQGVGLGLSIVKSLTEQLGGKIVIRSEPGKGTECQLELIMEKGEIKDLPVEIELTALPEGLRILLVEDTPINQMLALELLKKYAPSSVTDVADNGLVAIEKLINEPYDLVLMDVRMPVMNGIDATKKIRLLEGEQFKKLPVIGLTANAIPQQISLCIESGMNDVVTKPINARELISKIQKILGK